MNPLMRYETVSLLCGPARSDGLPTPLEHRDTTPTRIFAPPAETALIWRDEWCMGIPSLDADHRRLVTLVNQLLAGQPRSKPDLARTCDDPDQELAGTEPLMRFEALVDHLRHHFEREEALMLAIDYDDFRTHKCEHSLQLAELAELRRQLPRDRSAAFSRESLQWIKRWCFDHFISEDRRLARAYAESTRSSGRD
jgi:hemerythrin